MLKKSRIALLVVGVLLASQALADDKPVALVNGVAIPQSRVDVRVKAAVAQGEQDSPELRKMIRDTLINMEVLSQAAVKKGLDKQPDVIATIEMDRQNILSNAYLQDYFKTNPISDSAIQQEYDRLKAKASAKEYHVRHILVGSEDEAKAIVAQLKKGVKFEKLAAKSMDPGSAKNGGDLGWATPNAFVPQFADAMVKLNKGQVSEPVQSQFGWHVIRVDDLRDHKVPTLDEVKPQIAQALQQQAVQKAIGDLRNAAKVE